MEDRLAHILVATQVLQSLRSEAANALPDEACGILLGQGGRIERVQPARNVHPTPQTRFEIDPQALVDAHRAARAGEPDVLGYYHSHPTGIAELSATDRAMASGDGCVWALVAGDDVTFWRDDQDRFVKLSYIVTDR